MVTTDLWLIVVLLAVTFSTGCSVYWLPSGYYDYHVPAIIVAYCGTHVSSGHVLHRGVTYGNIKLADYS